MKTPKPRRGDTKLTNSTPVAPGLYRFQSELSVGLHPRLPHVVPLGLITEQEGASKYRQKPSDYGADSSPCEQAAVDQDKTLSN